jgi:hypothetical protein
MSRCGAGTLVFAPDGRTVLVADDQCKVEYGLLLVETATGRTRAELPLRELLPAFSWPPQACFAPDGRTLLFADGPAVAVLDALTGRPLHRRECHRSAIDRPVLSPGGRLLATPGSDATVLVWKTADFLRPARLPMTTLTEAEVAALWADLAGEDAQKASHAIRRLSLARAQSVPWLGRHLRPVPALRPEDRERLQRLVKDLDSDAFAVRQQAAADIEQMGEAAGPALEGVLQGRPSPEVRSAVAQLAARFDPAHSPDQLRLLRAVEVLEQIGTPAACQVLAPLSRGDPAAWLTREATAALARLAP